MPTNGVRYAVRNTQGLGCNLCGHVHTYMTHDHRVIIAETEAEKALLPSRGVVEPLGTVAAVPTITVTEWMALIEQKEGRR